MVADLDPVVFLGHPVFLFHTNSHNLAVIVVKGLHFKKPEIFLKSKCELRELFRHNTVVSEKPVAWQIFVEFQG